MCDTNNINLINSVLIELNDVRLTDHYSHKVGRSIFPVIQVRPDITRNYYFTKIHKYNLKDDTEDD